MPLKSILEAWDRPVDAEIIKNIIGYMKTMPDDNEALLLQCAEHLDKSQTLSSVLAVAHALNDSEIFLRCRDDDALESDLSSEFERLLGEDDKKYPSVSSLTPAARGSNPQ
jgi:hypothetical protein